MQSVRFSTTPLGEDWRHAGEHGHRSRSHFSNWVLKHPLTARVVLSSKIEIIKHGKSIIWRKIMVNGSLLNWRAICTENRLF